MNEIIVEFNNLQHNQNLFAAWQEEVRLRNRIRQCPPATSAIRVENSAELDFLLRSLYFTGRRHDFLVILFNNMNAMVACNWLNGKTAMTHAFLKFIPYHIVQTHPDHQHLQFLINIYKKEYQNEFVSIINVIDRDACQELLKRTANRQLRALLNQRQLQLQEQASLLDYGLNANIEKVHSYPTIYGDKLRLITRAARQLRSELNGGLVAPYSEQHFFKSLEAVDAVFEAGLVEDSAAIAAEVYRDYLDNSRTVHFTREEPLYHHLQQILRRIIPVYALSQNPTGAYPLALSCYRQCFSLISSDPASLQYLKIYETILEGMNGDRQVLPDIRFKAAAISNYRPDDAFIINLAADKEKQQPDLALKMHSTARERIKALPHEAFIILEFLRLSAKWYPEKEISPKLNLLDNYLELWKWAPMPIFFNQTLFQELSPGAEKSSRRQAQRILALMTNNRDKGNTADNNKPVFSLTHNLSQMNTLASILMGVK